MPATRHHPYGPSALPMYNACSAFERAEDDGSPSKDRDFGTDAHTRLEAMLKGEEVDWEGYSPFDKQELEWAVDTVKSQMSSEFPLEVEQELQVFGDSGDELTFGTVDVVNGDQIWDLKTGKMDPDFHYLQMAAYALGVMQRSGKTDKVRATILYSRLKVPYSFDITYDEAKSAVEDVFARIMFDEAIPTPNERCAYCAKAGNCDALLSIMESLTGNEIPADWEIDPDSWAMVSSICKKADVFISNAKSIIRKGMVDEQIQAPGLKVRNSRGNRYISDLVSAFPKVGLNQEEFLSCCSISVGNLEGKVADVRGTTKKETEFILEDELGELLQRGKDKAFVVEDKPRVPKKRKPAKKQNKTTNK